MASHRQIEANRRNAKLSTGPRIPRLREQEFNPATQPRTILAKEAVIAAWETPEEFKACQSEFRRAWKPIGFMEEVLVEKITIAYWKMRRVLRSEAAETVRMIHAANLQVMNKNPQHGRGDQGDAVQETANSRLELIVRTARGLIPMEEIATATAQYEFTVERQFYRAARMLMRLQDIRSGRNSTSSILEYDGL